MTLVAAGNARKTDAALAGFIVACLGVLVALFGGAYSWAQWHRMASVCQPDSQSSSVSYSWSWSAPGFTCTSSDGHSVSKLWW